LPLINITIKSRDAVAIREFSEIFVIPIKLVFGFNIFKLRL